jgi:hypothetical protein
MLCRDVQPWRLATTKFDGIAYQVLEDLDQLPAISHYFGQLIMSDGGYRLLYGQMI